MTYAIQSFHKFAEQDDFERGCLIGTGRDSSFSLSLKGKTLAELVQQIAAFFGIEAEAVTLNACEEAGRIDAELTENDDGHPATPAELASWKAGRLRLWAATYTCHVIKQEPAGWLTA